MNEFKKYLMAQILGELGEPLMDCSVVCMTGLIT